METKQENSEVWFENDEYFRLYTETPDSSYFVNPLVPKEQLEHMQEVMGCKNCVRKGYSSVSSSFNCISCSSTYFYNKAGKM
jgi:hypothetical protein